MASVISTEQYLWGLHRLLDGIATSQDADPEAAARPGWKSAPLRTLLPGLCLGA